MCTNKYQEALDKLTFEQLKEIIEDFKVDEYKQKKENYSNVFYLMNLRENTHSEILKWLFNINEQDIEKDSLRYNFVKKFFNKYIQSDIEKINFLEANSQVKNTNGIPDIVIETEKCILVIEVKLDARTSIVRDDKGNRRTQYERFKIFAEKEYPNKEEKKYILIYTTDKRLKNEQNFYIGNEYIKKMDGNKIVNQLGYISIEFSDIVLILYSILKETISQKKLTKEQNNITIKFIEKFLALLENNSDNKKENRVKTNNILDILKNNTGIGISKDILEEWQYQKPSRCNIPKENLHKLLNELQEKEVKELLIQYIDYWLYYNLFTDGYTEVIEFNENLFNIISICNKLKDKKIEEKKIQEKLTTINEIINNVKT